MEIKPSKKLEKMLTKYYDTMGDDMVAALEGDLAGFLEENPEISPYEAIAEGFLMAVQAHPNDVFTAEVSGMVFFFEGPEEAMIEKVKKILEAASN